MKLKYVPFAAAFVMALGPAGAYATYLGKMQVTSAPNENFSATVPVLDVTQGSKSLLAKLAPESTYARYGLTMPSVARGMTLTLESRSPLTLRLSGKVKPVEGGFPILMELHQDGDVTVREYNVVLGSSSIVTPVIPQVINKKGTPSPAAAPLKPSASESKAEKSPASAKAAAPVKAAAPKSDSQAAMTPIQRMRTRNYDLSKPVRVEAGYTPWSLGVLYHDLFPRASVSQVLAALVLTNPEAFPQGNVSVLKTGAFISAPSASLVNSIDKEKAAAAVQRGTSMESLRPRQSSKAPPEKSSKSKPIQKAPENKVPPKAAPEPAPAAQSEHSRPPSEASAEQSAPAPRLPDALVPEGKGSSAIPKVAPPPEVAEPEPVPTQEAAQTQPEPEPVIEEPPAFDISENQPEEESSFGWLWALFGVIAVIVLGACGWLFWRKKKSDKRFQALNDSFNHKAERKEPHLAPRGEPNVFARPAPSASPEKKVEVRTPAINPTVGIEPSNVFDFDDQVPVHPMSVKPQAEESSPAEAKAEASDTVPAAPVNPEPTSAPKAFEEDFTFTAPKEAPSAFGTESSQASKVNSVNRDASESSDEMFTSNAGYDMKDALEMAESFISINSFSDAQALLTEVVKNGSEEERQKARELLAKIDNHQ